MNQSGEGARDEEPNPENGNSVATPQARHHWVNSYPVTAARYGLDLFGPKAWNNKPCDLVISGPNYGWNTGYNNVGASGTLNIAHYAAVKRNIPAIAVSAQAGSNRFEDVTLYAVLIRKLVEALVESGKPLLPENVWLSVHFPRLKRSFPKEDAFKWVLARIDRDSEAIFEHGVKGLVDDNTFDQSDLGDLPTEQTVLGRCLNRISVSINAQELQCAPQQDKVVVKEKLLLSGLIATNEVGWIMTMLVALQGIVRGLCKIAL